ncbi:hypothetical protein AVEN_175556-1 [Araneus ventricosus]|uniref:Uncharacterized protein n=1 Tax=Araneus ventricosus TaxID=182803 RepID=A0A4Y2CMR9_ARAVE|nr:hypothetical protein AVEN_175556-1 [Araneus ventricosus]
MAVAATARALRQSPSSRHRSRSDLSRRRYRTPWSDSTGLGRVPFRATKPHTQYHYGSVVTHGERHPLGGFAEFPQEVGQRNGGGARVERIDKIPLAGKLKILMNYFLFRFGSLKGIKTIILNLKTDDLSITISEKMLT